MNDTAQTLMDRNNSLIEEMDRMFGQFLLLNFKHQKDTDTNLQFPLVGEMVYFRHKDGKFQKSKSHMRLGLIVAVSCKSLDGISRSVFVQARTICKGDADDGDAPTEKLFTRFSEDL